LAVVKKRIENVDICVFIVAGVKQISFHQQNGRKYTRRLFDGILDGAGKIKPYNITKRGGC
jgi:hypothetical protein